MGNCCICSPCTKLRLSSSRRPFWRKFWSSRCCCCCKKHDKRRSGVQVGNGKVHLITKMNSWEEKLSEANTNGKILVANFSASWCIPCKQISPVYNELADRYPSIIFVTVDVEELPEFSNQWKVDATPTFFFLKDGRQIEKLVGADKEELLKKMAEIADLTDRKE